MTRDEIFAIISEYTSWDGFSPTKTLDLGVGLLEAFEPENDETWRQIIADASAGALVRQLPVDWELHNRSYVEGRWIVVNNRDGVMGVGATPEAAVQNAFARAKADHDAALEEGEDEM